MKLEINNKKTVKRANMWKLNNMLLKNNGSTMKSKRKSENTLRQMKMETQVSKMYEN